MRDMARQSLRTPRAGRGSPPATPGPADGAPSQPATVEVDGAPRDPALRTRYASAALAQVPRLLGSVDRNPYRATYGCFDRQFWHYRTGSFSSGMYQEGVLPLALLYTHALPNSRWHREPRVRELAIAGLRFSARGGRADGSCDDYYPFERALGAAVFSLQAAGRACQLLELDAPDIRDWLERRARWVIGHDESGRLANHQALAALGLVRAAEITGRREFGEAAAQRVRRVLSWQSSEGWFEEYGGADPGYQTVTIDCLAKIRQITGDASLDEPLRRAVAFARLFLHPDDSYGGEYGSRGTYHFYPDGFELLAGENPAAAELADGFLRGLGTRRHAYFDDDRLFIHRLGNLIEAFLDWSPRRPGGPRRPSEVSTTYLAGGGLLVRRDATQHTVVSTARGGVFKHFRQGQAPLTDAGLILEAADGRMALSQRLDLGRRVEWAAPTEPADPRSMALDKPIARSESAGSERRPPLVHRAVGRLSVSGCLHWVRFETATPLKQALFHLGMWAVGRWCRTLVRRILQRRLITGRCECPIRLTRTFEFMPGDETQRPGNLRVTDQIELADPAIRIQRMSFSTDLEGAYVAASQVYQDAVLQPWTHLDEYVGELNERRRTTIVRVL